MAAALECVVLIENQTLWLNFDLAGLFDDTALGQLGGGDKNIADEVSHAVIPVFFVRHLGS